MEILKVILKQAGIPFYAFGSRVKGTNQRFSDLDLAYKDPIDEKVLIDIIFALEDSDLPIFVDLVDYNRCSASFKKIIDKDAVPLML